MTDLGDHLVALKAGGRKLLVPYVMAGIPDRAAWPAALTAVERHADAVEVGLPYSDPLMDGPVIAAAGERVIRAGIGPLDALELRGPGDPAVPRIVMTYFNPVHRVGAAPFCARARGAGFSGLIVPDIPLEESSSLRAAAARAGLAWIPLVSPTTPAARVERIAETATGFVYAVSTLGVTGTREELSDRAEAVATACRSATSLPVLVGIGVSTPGQAETASRAADGVVIGSAVVRAVLERGAAAAEGFLSEIRAALDGLSEPAAGAL